MDLHFETILIDSPCGLLCRVARLPVGQTGPIYEFAAHAVGSSNRPLSNLIYPSLLADAYSKHQTHFQDYGIAFASAIFPGVEYLTTLLAVAVPPGGVPQAALSFLPTAEWTPCAPHAVVLHALEELGNDDGYLLLTNQGHTVLLLQGERSSNGKCHQLYLVNSLGSQLQPAGSSSSSDGRGYMMRMQGRDCKEFEQQVKEHVNYDVRCGRWLGIPDWPNTAVHEKALAQLNVLVDLFKKRGAGCGACVVVHGRDGRESFPTLYCTRHTCLVACFAGAGSASPASGLVSQPQQQPWALQAPGQHRQQQHRQQQQRPPPPPQACWQARCQLCQSKNTLGGALKQVAGIPTRRRDPEQMVQRFPAVPHPAALPHGHQQPD